jgi:hypothetical protein
MEKNRKTGGRAPEKGAAHGAKKIEYVYIYAPNAFGAGFHAICAG